MQDVVLALPLEMFATGNAAAFADEWQWTLLYCPRPEDDHMVMDNRAIMVPLQDLVRWFSSTHAAAVAAVEQRLALAVGSRDADSALGEWLR